MSAEPAAAGITGGTRMTPLPRVAASGWANPTFRRMSGALLLIILCLALAAAASMEVLSSLRAYVSGEGLWSKGQKDAVHHLSRLATTRSSAEYAKFKAAIDIPLGDRQAREEMSKPVFDRAIARQGFLRGGNDPADIGRLIRLFRWGGEVSYMRRAVTIWIAADTHIMELAAIGEQLAREVGTAVPDQRRIDALTERVHALNSILTPMEVEFSSTINEAARAITRLLVLLLVLLSIALFAAGALAVRVLLLRAELLQGVLAEREERYRSLFENSLDAVLLSTPDGAIQAANPAACRLFGYTEAELRQAGRHGILEPDTPGLAEALAERARTGRFAGELEMRRKDGSRFIAEAASLIFTQPGGATQAYLIARDVTERKATQKRLVRLLDFNAAFRQFTHAIARTRDPAALFNHLCQCAVNRGGLGMASVLLIEPGTSSIRPAVSVGRVAGYFDRITLSTDPDSPWGNGPTATAIRAGSNYVCNDFAASPVTLPWREDFAAAGFASTAVFPLRQRGAIIGVLSLCAEEVDFFDQALVELMDQLAREVSFALDYIAEQKARETAEGQIKNLNRELEARVARRTADLEASNRALHASNQELAAFSYSVSHDLRAPLRAINGFSTLLQEEYGKALAGPGQDYLLRLREASISMDRLTTGLLELAQIGRSSLARTDVNLSHVASAVTRDLQRGEPERSAQFLIADEIHAYADPALIRVVLHNLLANAWKFTRHEASPRIGFGIAEVDGVKAYFVSDNGAGFDMAYAGKIFGAFARLHKAEEFEGTGIGLATVKRIVDRHEGRLWAKAGVGEGAVFYFTL